MRKPEARLKYMGGEQQNKDNGAQHRHRTATSTAMHRRGHVRVCHHSRGFDRGPHKTHTTSLKPMARSSIAFLQDELEIGILEQKGSSVIGVCVNDRMPTIDESLLTKIIG